MADRSVRSSWAQPRSAAPRKQSLSVRAGGADSLVSPLAIEAEGLGKRYRIGERERYRALRETISKAVSAPLHRLRSLRGPIVDNSIWALRDVDLEVHQGEWLGVIGHNGAGQRTLLTMLS